MTQYDHVKTTQNTLIINLDVDVMYSGNYDDNADWIAEQHKDILKQIRALHGVINAEIEDVEER